MRSAYGFDFPPIPARTAPPAIPVHDPPLAAVLRPMVPAEPPAPEPTAAPLRLFERGAAREEMAVRLARAAHCIMVAGSGRAQETHALRAEQTRVFADFAAFLLELTARPSVGDHLAPYGRIILPPRTGKTVIAGHILSRTELTTTFLVPTRTLVEQSARELSALLPGLPVGVYFSERKELVDHGVNVTTYQILQRDLASGAIPACIAASALIFADEAHHALTEDRVALLSSAFHPGAVRVALTATPDYDDERVLCRYFPALIHELTLEEAMDLQLLAPLRLWVVEVDADASQVRVLASDYEEESLGRVMSAAPFARAVQVFRYLPQNRDRPTLIACASRQQAQDLRAYLSAHRPRDTPPPALILGDTPSAARELGLELFERGDIDTLIQVGVLIEGWNSPRCKLLIDLAPSLSRVRATQKYCRVMTRQGDREARIYVLLPTGLPKLPILPTELFGPSQRSYECGALLGASPRLSSGTPALDLVDGGVISGVTLKKRVVLQTAVTRPLLRRDRPRDIARVLRSCRDFDPACPVGVFHFRGLWFDHPLFRGRGEFLLRWLGIAATRVAYLRLLSRLFPDAPGSLLLAADGLRDPPWCREDRRALRRALRQGDPGDPAAVEAFRQCWRAVTGHQADAQLDPEARVLRQEERLLLGYALRFLPLPRRRAVALFHGLLDQRQTTYDGIAIADEVTCERIRQRYAGAWKMLRGLLVPDDDGRITVRPRLKAGRSSPPFRRSDPPPALGPTNPRDAHAQHWPCWQPLPRPFAPRELLALVAAVLAHLGLPQDVVTATPTFKTWREAGVAQGEARWQADTLQIDLVREGHPVTLHEGGVGVVTGLWACVSGLPRATQLLLCGPLGQLDHYALLGAHPARVAAALRAALVRCGSPR